jgi:hypothetical protein
MRGNAWECVGVLNPIKSSPQLQSSSSQLAAASTAAAASASLVSGSRSRPLAAAGGCLSSLQPPAPIVPHNRPNNSPQQGARSHGRRGFGVFRRLSTAFEAHNHKFATAPVSTRRVPDRARGEEKAGETAAGFLRCTFTITSFCEKKQ